MKRERMEKLLTNNTGYSLKSWIMFQGFRLGAFLLLILPLVLYLHPDTNPETYILSVTGLMTATGLGKIVNEVINK